MYCCSCKIFKLMFALQIITKKKETLRFNLFFYVLNFALFCFPFHVLVFFFLMCTGFCTFCWIGFNIAASWRLLFNSPFIYARNFWKLTLKRTSWSLSLNFSRGVFNFGSWNDEIGITCMLKCIAITITITIT